MPFDVNRYRKDENKSKKVEDEKLDFNFNPFNNKGVLSRGYYFYSENLYSFYLNIILYLIIFLFGDNSFYNICAVISFILMIIMHYNLTYKRLVDIFDGKKFNKFLVIVFMLPILNFGALLQIGEITPKLKTSSEYKLIGENNNFIKIYGFIKPLWFIVNCFILIAILLILVGLYTYLFNYSDKDVLRWITREIISNGILWLIWFIANINKFITYLKIKKTQDNPNVIYQGMMKDENIEEQCGKKEEKLIKKKNNIKKSIKKVCNLVMKLLKNYRGLSKNMTMIIIALIIAFAYIQVEQNKINYKEKIRQEEQQVVNEQREELEACIDRVEESYYDTWESNCKAKGLKNNCSLPLSLANSLEKDRENAKKTCMDRFKNKAF